MPEPDAERRRPRSGSAGIGEMAAGTLGTLLDYLHARVALLGLEAREARNAILFRVVCGVACGFFLMVSWIALVVGAVGWLAGSQGWPWPLVAIGCALIHIAAAFILFLAARRRFAEPPFQDSLNELDKDRQWLKRHRPEN